MNRDNLHALIAVMLMILCGAVVFYSIPQSDPHSCDIASRRIGASREDLKAACPNPIDIFVNHVGDNRIETWSFNEGEVLLKNGIIESFDWYARKADAHAEVSIPP